MQGKCFKNVFIKITKIKIEMELSAQAKKKNIYVYINIHKYGSVAEQSDCSG